MPKQAKSHHDCRGDVCLMCSEKAPGMSLIQPGSVVLKRVLEFFWKDYDLNNQRFPNALCSKDRMLLLGVSQGKVDKEIASNKE